MAISSNQTWTDEQLMPLVYLYGLCAAPLVPIDRARATLRNTVSEAGWAVTTVQAVKVSGCLGLRDRRRLRPAPSTAPTLKVTYAAGSTRRETRQRAIVTAPCGQRYRARLLHNGSLDNLRQLLCLEERPDGAAQAKLDRSPFWM